MPATQRSGVLIFNLLHGSRRFPDCHQHPAIRPPAAPPRSVNHHAATPSLMSTYTVAISWQRGTQPFIDNKYSRRHSWVFDGGFEVQASSSPDVVPLPYSDAQAVDPEEAFVASLSSCHMLWFLSVAAKQGFVVESYRDEAVGVMARNAEGKLAMARVTLRPRLVFGGDSRPTAASHEAMHAEAHE